ncbi:putative prolyl oligopeptidase [Rosellinia necatrix]|uniref:Putative prolyl oligopeptidase n=1 Tax=Rosellinia necatrix TaxID=77044 RepID=A0A1W2TIV9_ROSNE|nr:putative prolyl oligopeptidase [Rosellinia necatrix]
MLPRPCLSFTLPSIHDKTKLDCRIYHPLCLRDPSHESAPWSGHTAVVAHPYAPLGGCFDDPIVDVAAGTLLQLGFLVVTFNFRGASSSGGRTSWTSKPEQADYISVVGFLAYYAHYLDLSPRAHPTDQQWLPVMLLAGYSYGAMITTRLPPLDTILSYFSAPATHSAEADIRLRAQHLAEAWNADTASPASPRKSFGVRIGGEEDSSWRSQDSNGLSESQREERIRESVRHLLSRAKLDYRRSLHWSSQGERKNEMDHCLEKVEGGVAFQSAYLIISPPVGIVTNLATMSFSNLFSNPFSSSWVWKTDTHTQEGSVANQMLPLTSNPTLAIYGGQDGFITDKKIREWTRQLSRAEASQFRYVQVSEAGHFWLEGRALHQLRDAIGAFATELTRRR